MRQKSTCRSGLANVFRAFSNRQCPPVVKVDFGPVSVPLHEFNRIQINFYCGLRDVVELFPSRHV
jgi:hypothetical protein